VAKHNKAALRTFACGSLSFPKNRFCFLFPSQTVEILQNGTAVASVPYSITFASRLLRIMVSQKT